MSCPGVSHGNQPDALKNDDMGHSGAFGCHHLPLIFCRGLIHLFFSPGAQASIPYSNMSSLEPWESDVCGLFFD